MTIAQNGAIQYPMNNSRFSNRTDVSPACIHKIAANASTATSAAVTGRPTQAPSA